MRGSHDKTVLFVVVLLLLITLKTCRSLSVVRRGWNRRELLEATASAVVSLETLAALPVCADEEVVAKTTPYLAEEYYKNVPKTNPSAGRSFFPTLTPPLRNRATYRYELGRNAWALEQLLAFQNVTATIRTNVIKLERGGLWVHSPQWPTKEFCSLLDELGDVEHVVLPCNAFEHKAPVKAFTKRYPKASVWISPGQYSPLGSCGISLDEPCNMGFRVDGIFSGSSDSNTGDVPPWADEFDWATLFIDIPGNAGPVSEVAFCHRPTNTLVATDAVVYIPKEPSLDIFRSYFPDDIVDDPTFWPRTVLQSVFLPLRQEGRANEYPGFDAIQERLIRAPILRGFTDSRAPEAIREWIASFSQWKYDRILTSHFASPIAATPKDVYNVFQYLQDDDRSDSLPPIACKDWELLDDLNRVIEQNKLGAPVVYDYAPECS